MIVFVNSSLEVSCDTSIESVVSAEEDVGVSHGYYYLNICFLLIVDIMDMLNNIR